MFSNKVQEHGKFIFNGTDKKRKQPDSNVLTESVVALLSVTQKYRQNLKTLEDELYSGKIDNDEVGIDGVEVYVYKSGTNELATVYKDGLNAIQNQPIITSNNGHWDAPRVNLSDIEDYHYEHIKSVKDLIKEFYINRATGDGNCLFYSLSTATFGTDAYFNEIRAAICDYMENNYIEDLQLIDKQNYINNMRKNGTFGGNTEVQIYSIISKLKIVSFVRKLQAINKYNADDSDETYCFISGKKKYQ